MTIYTVQPSATHTAVLMGNQVCNTYTTSVHIAGACFEWEISTAAGRRARGRTNRKLRNNNKHLSVYLRPASYVTSLQALLSSPLVTCQYREEHDWYLHKCSPDKCRHERKAATGQWSAHRYIIEPVYASKSSPRPILWPPWLKFFPSTRVDSVIVTPARHKTSH